MRWEAVAGAEEEDQKGTVAFVEECRKATCNPSRAIQTVPQALIPYLLLESSTMRMSSTRAGGPSCRPYSSAPWSTDRAENNGE